MITEIRNDFHTMLPKRAASVIMSRSRSIPPFLRNFGSIIPPSLLWHYTGGLGFNGMIQSGSIWTTHASCFVDFNEISYSVSILLSEADKSSRISCSGKEVLLYRELNKQMQKLIEDRGDVYLVSFTAQEDNVDHWRDYGGGSEESGFSIAFGDLSFGAGFFLVEVNYDENVVLDVAACTVSWLKHDFNRGLEIGDLDGRELQPEDWARKLVSLAVRYITAWAVCNKRPKFRREAEWRLVKSPETASPKPEELRYSYRDSIQRRHLPVTFANKFARSTESCSNAKRRGILKVLVGPGDQQVTFSEAAKELLLKHNQATENEIASDMVAFSKVNDQYI